MLNGASLYTASQSWSLFRKFQTRNASGKLVARLRISHFLQMSSETGHNHFLSRHCQFISLMSPSTIFRYYQRHKKSSRFVRSFNFNYFIFKDSF
jgi:hypothetical protein